MTRPYANILANEIHHDDWSYGEKRAIIEDRDIPVVYAHDRQQCVYHSLFPLFCETCGLRI